jgi:acid stress-induced BolA-like protein IbaG/YrbA
LRGWLIKKNTPKIKRQKAAIATLSKSFKRRRIQAFSVSVRNV